MKAFLMSMGLVLASYSVLAQVVTERTKPKPAKFTVSAFFGGTGGFPVSYSNDLSAVVAGYSNKDGATSLGLSLSYLLYKNFGVAIQGERETYAVSNGILFNRRHPYPLEEVYPEFYATDLINNLSDYKYFRNDLAGGLFYRFSWKRWSLEPGLYLGVTFIKPPYQDLFLKEKGSNYTRKVHYEGLTGSGLDTRAGLKIAYRIKRWSFLFNYQYAQSLPQIRYEITSSDVFGNQTFSIMEQREILKMRHVFLGLGFDF